MTSIASSVELRELVGPPEPIAGDEVIPRHEAHWKRFISLSPFICIRDPARRLDRRRLPSLGRMVAEQASPRLTRSELEADYQARLYER
jgi:hypothetical protein